MLGTELSNDVKDRNPEAQAFVSTTPGATLDS